MPLLLAFSGCFLGHGRDGEEPRDAGVDAGISRSDSGPRPVHDAGPPPPSDAGVELCSAIDAEEVRAPRYRFEDQRFAATIRNTSAMGCSCTPRAIDIPDAVLLEICDCCLECACIDSGYEVGYSSEPLPVGEQRLVLGGVEVEVTVAERATCRPLAAEGIEIVGPDRMLIPGGERLWWALVTGFETVCCVDPAPAVEHSRDGNTIDITVRTCNQVDCDCIGAPVPYAAWHPLGELPPGTYTARADGVHDGPHATFTVE